MADYSTSSGDSGGGGDALDLQRKALLAQLQSGGSAGAYEAGGLTGGAGALGTQAADAGMADMPGTLTTAPPPEGAPEVPGGGGAAGAPAVSSGLGAYANKMGGFNMDKFADPNRSEKYKIGEVMSQFDPRGGVTPEMLKALNALGIADFSGQGDQLTVNNTKNDPRFGRGGTADVVKGLKGNNEDTAWTPWFVGDQDQASFPGRGNLPPDVGAPTMGMGGGSDTAGALTDPGFFQKLLAQARAQTGGAGMDRNALISQLGM